IVRARSPSVGKLAAPIIPLDSVPGPTYVMSDAPQTIEPVSPPHETAAGFAAAQVLLKPRKAQPFFGRHPWVLDTAIAKLEGAPADGDVVDLISEKGHFIARGLFNSNSRLRVRLYTWDAGEALDEAFFRRRLEAAVALRRDLGYSTPNGATR